jgi:hypothetical protein
MNYKTDKHNYVRFVHYEFYNHNTDNIDSIKVLNN